MKKYLVEIQYDCNDADYVYGLKIIDENQKAILDKNMDKEVSFGSYDFGGGDGHPLEDSISIREITEEQAKVLTELGLDNFGEGDSLECKLDEFGDDDEDEGE